MYDFIKGKLIEKNPASAVIDCNGVGYLINISLNTYSKLKDENCLLYTHLAVREDAMSLYGFFDKDERQLFRMLISVSGVGSSTAQLILSSLSPEKAVEAIVNNNISMLQSVKGIGNKTAQRIILDLRDKISKVNISKDILSSTHNTNREEALSGLVMLGFSKQSAEKTLDRIISQKGDALSVEDLIKLALQNL